MQDLIEDLRAALGQMNRSLTKIAEQTEGNTKLLQDIKDKLK
jgi:hypothetical protein